MSTHSPRASILAPELAFALEAAREAGLRLVHLRASGRWSGETLGDVADHAADGFLQGMVRGRWPEDGLLSEETADSPQRLAKSRVWIVDPLDGTKEYRDLREDWAVHVALCLDGRPALGVVALPTLELLVWGVCLGGRREAGLEGLRGPVAAELSDGAGPGELRIAASRSHRPSWMDDFAAALPGASTIEAGSVGFKVGLCLLGRADVYVHRRGLKEWDTAAPEAVARALGWSISRLDGAEHVYNAPDPRNDELVVCRPARRESVLAALRRAGVGA